MARMSDFYTEADKLRQSLRELFPKGYVKREQNGNMDTIIIRNFGTKPLKITRLEFMGDGKVAHEVEKLSQ